MPSCASIRARFNPSRWRPPAPHCHSDRRRPPLPASSQRRRAVVRSPARRVLAHRCRRDGCIRCGGRAAGRRPAIRSAVLGLVLASHPARRRKARGPRLALAVGLIASAARRPGDDGARRAYVTGLSAQRLREVERLIDYGPDGRFLVAVAGNASEVADESRSFERAVATTFAALASVVLLVNRLGRTFDAGARARRAG